MKLTPKQQAFADYYITSGNATEAATKAGYSKKTAFTIGCENLKKPYIKEYIDKILEETHNDRIADMKEVKERVTAILREKNVNADVKDLLKAAEFIAKVNGAFLDRTESSIKIEMPAIVIGKEDE